MNYIAHEKQQTKEGPWKDIKGEIIRLGDFVAYGDYGNSVNTGYVKRIWNNSIDITNDQCPQWERRVQIRNSDNMIVVLNNILNK